jgi:uncharacterized membrane protein YphA (DoxX/SURF4 family)
MQSQAPALAADLQAEIAAQQKPSTPEWSLPARIAFRFAFVYFVLYSFPGPLGVIPGVGSLFGWYEKLSKAVVIWTGAHILHLSQPVQYNFTGSGDTVHDYIQNMLIFIIAAVGMVIWSVLDRRRREYRYMHEWLRFYMRLWLGATLIGYGAFKVIKAQFPHLFLTSLLEPYGESSPMGLLWNFMGYSTTYNIFAGSVEMLGGALVILPWMATLGALLCAAAMSNVFVLNMAYDVPVKLFSFNLLLMSGFLLVPELNRLTNVFILNRPALPPATPALFKRRSLSIGLLVAQILFLSWSAGSSLHQSYKQATQYGDLAPRPSLYGIYAVDELSIDGQIRPPLLTDPTTWRRVTFDLYGVVGFVPPEGPVRRYRSKLDEKAGTLELSKPSDQKWKANFKVDQPSPNLMVLSGEMDGKKIVAKLHKVELNSFLLNNRGFHWISEFPFNR